MKLEYGPAAYFNFTSHAAFGSDVKTWFRLLWHHRKEIERKFIPKILYITMMVLINVPVAFYERMIYDKQIWKTPLYPPVFILGHPRSGTTYLHYVLSRDPRFAYCSVYESFMPWIFLTSGKYIKRVMDRLMPSTRPMDNLKLGAEFPKEEEFALGCMGEESMVTGYYFPQKIYGYFRKYVLFKEVDRSAVVNWKSNLVYFMQKLNYKYGGRPLLLKSPANTARVKLLLEMFPDAKFIHIYRNPYTVYCSNERLYEKTLPFLSFQHVTPEVIEDFIFKSYRDMYQNYFEEKKQIPKGNLVEFSYEEFVSNELEVLKRAYLELGLHNFYSAKPAFENEVRQYHNYETNKYDLDEALKEKIYSNWKFAFDELGYPR